LRHAFGADAVGPYTRRSGRQTHGSTDRTHRSANATRRGATPVKGEERFTLVQAVDRLDLSTTKLYRVENGLAALKSVAELRALLDRYGVTDEEDIDFLVEIHRDSLNRGWWSQYQSVMPSGMAIGETPAFLHRLAGEI
jgi:hypothetical protein